DTRILLVLDNFEQVLPAGGVVGELLAGCPDLTVIVTSRSALRLRIEHEFPVSPLAVPAPPSRSGRQYRGPAELSAYGAVALFVERAITARPDFKLTDENAGAVVGICRRVDGLPLAIELVSAHARLLSP